MPLQLKNCRTSNFILGVHSAIPLFLFIRKIEKLLFHSCLLQTKSSKRNYTPKRIYLLSIFKMQVLVCTFPNLICGSFSFFQTHASYYQNVTYTLSHNTFCNQTFSKTNFLSPGVHNFLLLVIDNLADKKSIAQYFVNKACTIAICSNWKFPSA